MTRMQKLSYAAFTRNDASSETTKNKKQETTKHKSRKKQTPPSREMMLQAKPQSSLCPRAFPGARDNIRLDRAHLARIQDFLERRHAKNGALPSQDNGFDVLQGRGAGIAQIGQRAGHRIAAMTASAIGGEQQLPLMY